jgi:hypothetical protein
VIVENVCGLGLQIGQIGRRLALRHIERTIASAEEGQRVSWRDAVVNIPNPAYDNPMIARVDDLIGRAVDGGKTALESRRAA